MGVLRQKGKGGGWWLVAGGWWVVALAREVDGASFSRPAAPVKNLVPAGRARFGDAALQCAGRGWILCRPFPFERDAAVTLPLHPLDPSLFARAQALLDDEWLARDPDLGRVLPTVLARNVGQDWHKAGTFRHHLMGVARARWQVGCVRLRGGDPFSLVVEACDETGRIAVPAAARDRATAARTARVRSLRAA